MKNSQKITVQSTSRYVTEILNDSFCLINSRVPLLDLIDFTTYTHRDVDRLSAEEGRTLLQNVGVKGSEQDLDRVVADWDGYALVLSLLGAYLVDVYNGDVKHIRDISPPTADEPRYDRVKRVLRRYDKHLTQAEKEFLTVFSAFRLGVSQSAFTPIFKGVIPGYLPPRRETPSFVNRFIWQLQRLVDRLFPIYEADIRVALAWAHLAEGNYSVAQVQAEKAQGMSVEMGYHWAQVDAAEVLAGLKQLSQSVLN